MLSASSRSWPHGNDWVLQPKWDGFRLLIEIPNDGRRPQAWSRHETNLTSRLGDLLEPFTTLPGGSILDGELVIVSDRDGRPVQDFAAVCAAVLTARGTAQSRLQYVAFDVLAYAARDLRGRPWRERDHRLREVLPNTERIRPIGSLPATPAVRAAIVELGFEGTVMKRPSSTYRPGRHNTWIKHKARHATQGVLLSTHQHRDGHWHAICDHHGGRAHAIAGADSTELVGQTVNLIYSRVDADGALREVRLAPASPITSSGATASTVRGEGPADWQQSLVVPSTPTA
jgi:ATP-dependent DNA ligase